MAINTLPTEPVYVQTLDEYQDVSSGTAFYPGQGEFAGVCYVALKMNGEAGEFAEHVGKALRDDGTNFHTWPEYIKQQRQAALKKELGDVLWYVAAAARELGWTLSEVANANIEKLQDRQRRNALQGSGDDR